jgi:hypothetical protein
MDLPPFVGEGLGECALPLDPSLESTGPGFLLGAARLQPRNGFPVSRRLGASASVAEDKIQIRWRRLAFIGISLGLSIGSVLTFVFPAAASLCMFAILTFGCGSRPYKQRLAELAALIVPALTVAFVINVGPLSKATRDHFAIGFGSVLKR